MSLINDALKRAKQAEPEPSSIPAAAGPMQPVDYQRGRLPWYFVPCLLAVMVGACWFLLKGWDAHRQAAIGYGEPITVKAREPVTPLQPADAGPSAEPAFAVAINTTASSAPIGMQRNFSLEDSSTPAAPATPASAPTTTAGTPDAASTPSPANGPTFRLQGIFYRSANPSAMVNGKSVFVGDRVSGARVRAIERDNVTLEYDGQLKTLTLE